MVMMHLHSAASISASTYHLSRIRRIYFASSYIADSYSTASNGPIIWHSDAVTVAELPIYLSGSLWKQQSGKHTQ
jgi:hypothetical protein